MSDMKGRSGGRRSEQEGGGGNSAQGPRRIGYARVSPEESGLAEQKAALEDAGCSQIFDDQPNSTASDGRPALDAALAKLKQGDTLVVWRLDRLGHSLPQLVETMKEVADRGVHFRSLREDIDTSLPGGEVVYQVMVALVECERALISERTRAGMRAAQAQGRPLGRRPSLSADQRRDVLDAIRERGEPLEEVARRYNVHSRTIRRVLAAERGGAFAEKGAARNDGAKKRAARSGGAIRGAR